MAPPAINPQTACRLFGLPAEIRNEIYTLALFVGRRDEGSNAELGQQTTLLTKCPQHPERPSVLSLLQTCRLVLEEAHGIFYSTHWLDLDVYLEGRMRLGVFTKALSGRRLSAFRQVSVRFCNAEDCGTLLRCLAGFPRLTHVLIRLRTPVEPGKLHLAYLRRERPFLRRACGELPTSLRHVHFVVEGDTDVNRHMSREEMQEFREQLVRTLWKPLQHDDESSPTAQRQSCPCLWCDSNLEVRASKGQRHKPPGNGTMASEQGFAQQPK